MTDETPGTPLTPKSESEAWREFQASMPRGIFGKRRQQIEDAALRYASAVILLDREREVRTRETADLRAVDWHEVMLDALTGSDNGNNPFYRDDDDTVSLAAELAEAVKARLR